ncbi:hypothetical protein C8T65DRAFT_737260 [Cerioporus squamosus]|nr:hypothetical protein C8T65DRAFT_737260 [Cerioporus squamosus]
MDVDDKAANGFIPDLNIRSPLLEIFDQLQASSGIESSHGEATTNSPDIEIDWARVTGGLRLQPSTEETALARISSALRAYLLDSADIGCESDDEEESGNEGQEDEEDNDAQDQSGGTQSSEDGVDEQPGQSHSDMGQPSRPSHIVSNMDNPCFPWLDREILIPDILRHILRCVFSEKQNTVIHWALITMGISDIPTEHTMDRVTRALQRIYGVASIRYKGAMGHIYYVNDMAALIAQEVANPQVRKHLHFLPEDAGRRLSEVWQGSRWLRELDPDLATPMLCIHDQDFYVLEPAQLHDSCICMPVRFFTRGKDTMAWGWMMVPTADKSGWVIAQHMSTEIRCHDVLTSFPVLWETYHHHDLPDPCIIIGVQTDASGRLSPWTAQGTRGENHWRQLAKGHRVFAFPMWLFCDDTSSNVSKKWNKHNSFLFTAAGLPRCLVHHEYNVHFLATSNAAPPLEMLDGIADQLLACQTLGVWAWDCELQEMVLLEMINILKSQFVQARRVGGKAEYKLFRITTQRGLARSAKEAEVVKTVRTIPGAEEGATSPIWHIKDFDPHLDTPVKILHVVLLGFVKYFWRDAMSRLKDPEKEKLIVRLNSFDVAGLGFPPLSGATLINFAGSLIGCDFRALAQVVPFVLHDFASIPKESIEVWTALSYIIPLVWQPEIEDIDAYTTCLKEAIDTFLDVTCKLTPRWFNKPKFHILLHLPDHIQRFRPAMLFATEGFESFNAWDATEASRKGLAIPVSDPNAEFCTVESALLRSGEQCFSDGQWLGKVQEIIQVATSSSALFGKADFALVQHAEVAEQDPHYDMPHIVLHSRHSLVPIQDIQCTVNVQHNCAARQCKIVNIERVGCEEQEKTKRLAKAVRHTAPDDLILNAVQMRNSAKLMPLCCTVQQLDRDCLIHLAAMQEIEVARCCRTRAAATQSQSAGAPPSGPSGAGMGSSQLSQSVAAQTSNSSDNVEAVAHPLPSRHHGTSMDSLIPPPYPHPMYHDAPDPSSHIGSLQYPHHYYNHGSQLQSAFYPSHQPIPAALHPQRGSRAVEEIIHSLDSQGAALPGMSGKRDAHT